MNSYLGIIRKVVSGTAKNDDEQCISELSDKFPSAFKNAVTASVAKLKLFGCFERAIEGEDTLLFKGSVFNIPGINMTGNHTADLLSLIRQDGLAAVKKVNGQFVIIYCNKNGVHIINDHLGVEQVLYFEHDELIVFGSSARHIQAHPGCPKGVDWEKSLRRPLPHVVLGTYKSYDTWFKGIKLLPEASIFSTDAITGTSSLGTYWRPQDARPGKDDKRTAAEVMEEYAALLDDAVRIRMNAGGVSYSLMSGGLDSSAICGLASKHGRLDTFSMINQTTVLEGTTRFCHKMADEMSFGNEQYLVPYHELCFNQQLWKQRVWRAESPVNHTDSLTKTMLHYAIRKNRPEITAVLSGTGSDQMNGGLVGYVAAVTDDRNQSWQNFYNEILDTENRKMIRRDEESLWNMRKLVNREYLSAISNTPLEPNYWMVCVDGALHSQAYSLMWDEQRASAAHGHDTYYPFMDYRMAEFIAAVPGHLHHELFFDKQILREPSKKFVPEYIVNKPKMPYSLPEYDFRVELYEFLTADNDRSLFTEAFGDLDMPHPVINKQQLYNRIKALRNNPDVIEWQSIMHIINLGILDKLCEQDERSMNYEATLEVPQHVSFREPSDAMAFLQQRLSVMTEEEMLERPVRFAENCSLLIDAKTNAYYLSKRNSLVYEIGEGYTTWLEYLRSIDGSLDTRQILNRIGAVYSDVEEFFMMSLKEQILLITDKRTGY